MFLTTNNKLAIKDHNILPGVEYVFYNKLWECEENPAGAHIGFRNQNGYRIATFDEFNNMYRTILIDNENDYPTHFWAFAKNVNGAEIQNAQ